MPYAIEYSDVAERHLQALTARQRHTVLDAILRHLAYQPGVRTRNRKPMEENPLGAWVLRIGEIRVYYRVEEEPQPVVTIVAVGLKDRNLLRAGGQLFDLTGPTRDEDNHP